MNNKTTWHEAIQKVLSDHPNQAMHSRDIADEILSRGLKETVGATPDATVNAQIVTSMKNKGEKSPYVKVGKGLYADRTTWQGETFSPGSKIPKGMDPHVGASSGQEAQLLGEDEIEEKQYDVVTSFGMFWLRDNVLWKANPRLLGVAHAGSDQVDFGKQHGVYLLYDGREVIYVGRVLDRPLGQRLYEHTMDRLTARWDRFSWFGLRPVTEDGELLALDKTPYTPDKLIPALEAILIEAVEPRQNRKRGDDLARVEFIQRVDPKIEKEQKKNLLQELMRQTE